MVFTDSAIARVKYQVISYLFRARIREINTTKDRIHAETMAKTSEDPENNEVREPRIKNANEKRINLR